MYKILAFCFLFLTLVTESIAGPRFYFDAPGMMAVGDTVEVSMFAEYAGDRHAGGQAAIMTNGAELQIISSRTHPDYPNLWLNVHHEITTGNLLELDWITPGPCLNGQAVPVAVAVFQVVALRSALSVIRFSTACTNLPVPNSKIVVYDTTSGCPNTRCYFGGLALDLTTILIADIPSSVPEMLRTTWGAVKQLYKD